MTGGSRKNMPKRSQPGRLGGSKHSVRVDDGDYDSPVEIITKGETNIKENGVVKRLTIEHATEFGIYQQAIDGNGRATAEVFRWIVAREKARPSERPRCPIPIFDHGSPHELDEVLLLLGMTTKLSLKRPGDDKPYLQLDAGLVRFALTKRRKKRLSRKQWDNIKENTLNAHDLLWPAEADFDD